MQIHMINQNFILQTKSEERLQKFLRKYHGKHLVVLELGFESVEIHRPLPLIFQ